MRSARLIDCYVHISDDNIVGYWDVGSRYAEVPLMNVVLRGLKKTIPNKKKKRYWLSLGGGSTAIGEHPRSDCAWTKSVHHICFAIVQVFTLAPPVGRGPD